MRGFAFFLVFSLFSAALSWVAIAASAQAETDGYRLVLMQLSRKRVIGEDISATLRNALSSAEGETIEERAADASRRLLEAEAFLERSYAAEGVDLDVFFGFLGDSEYSGWMQGIAQTRRLQKCPRCFDLSFGGGVAGILGERNGKTVISRNGLYRNSSSFGFGTPVVGAVFAFGDVVGVDVVK